MAPQYTSTLHFLTRHSLCGRSVCVVGVRGSEGGRGYVFLCVERDRPVKYLLKVIGKLRPL